MKIGDYFSALERSISKNMRLGSIDDEFACLASDDFNGLVKFRLFFWDNSYLDVYEVVNTEQGYPIKIRYAYTYLRRGQRVFRYDNAPHHPEIFTHPHHKHLGSEDRLRPASEPTLARIIEEIEPLLGSE